MLDGVSVFCQSSIKIEKGKIIYFDPYKIEKEYNDADFIFITHDHFDHYDENSIKKVMKDSSYIVVPTTLVDEVINIFDSNRIIEVVPNKDYVVDGLEFTTVSAYNINKKFHPKENGWVGYVINLNEVKYYAMGDTDDIPEAREVICDVLFIPVGGTYTMNSNEAVNFTNFIKPKIAVPIHYKTVVGTFDDALYFINHLDENIDGKILMN